MIPELEQKAIEWRAAWMRAWSSTDRADRSLVEATLTSMYRRFHLRPPEFAWVESPSQATAVANSAEMKHKLRMSMWPAFQIQKRGLAPHDPLDFEMLQKFPMPETHRQVFLSPDFPPDRIGLNFHYRNLLFPDENIYSKLAASTFLREIMSHTDMDMNDDDVGLLCDRTTLAKAVWHWWPFRDVCIISDRPTALVLDDLQRLSSLSGPALTFADGWKVCAVRGVVVPPSWITERDRLSVETALTWPNVEQRRIAAELIGWAKILEQLHPTVIDEHSNPQVGTLLEVQLERSEARNQLLRMPERFLRVQCGTGRVFVLPVPRSMRTALEANAWTYNIDPDQLLKLEVRT